MEPFARLGLCDRRYIVFARKKPLPPVKFDRKGSQGGRLPRGGHTAASKLPCP